MVQEVGLLAQFLSVGFDLEALVLITLPIGPVVVPFFYLIGFYI